MIKKFDIQLLAVAIEKMIAEHPDWTRYQILRWLRDFGE